MKITLFGMGYVGVTTAACFAKDGHHVTGVELSEAKVALLNAGESPIVEKDVGELVRAGVQAGRLRATTSVAEGLADAEIAVVCVGTPSRADGGLDTSYLVRVAREIGTVAAARGAGPKPLVVVRSTVFPGTVRAQVLPILRETCGADAPPVVFHPEFLREGSSVEDFFAPPKIVVGEERPGVGAPLLTLYTGIDAPRFVTSIETAEMVKYADNAFHAAKVTFANEIGQLAQAAGVDSREVMEIFCADTKLNVSPRYLRPGFAFGGSCLPKDLRALTYVGKQRDVNTPMLGAVMGSNRAHIDHAIERIMGSGIRKVGMVGLSFKKGTDDLRESPLVELAERLLGKGLRLAIHDEHVRINRLVGRNRAYVDQFLPHLASLLVGDEAEVERCDLLVLGHRQPRERVAALLAGGRKVVDLTGANLFPQHPAYRSIV